MQTLDFELADLSCVNLDVDEHGQIWAKDVNDELIPLERNHVHAVLAELAALKEKVELILEETRNA